MRVVAVEAVDSAAMEERRERLRWFRLESTEDIDAKFGDLVDEALNQQEAICGA